LKRGAAAVVLVSAALTLASCASSASSSPSKAGKGFRAVEATVVGKQYDPPGSPGTAMSGSGNYSLDFEARDGEATVHYRFPVTRDQFNRYHEGDRVQLMMADDQLRDIRPVQ
jgi:hypothetical protein